MPSSPPRVSIAIPVYNAVESIGETLESALAQTFADLEVVVVDNASTDGTGEVVRQIADRRVRLHHNVVNIGFHRNTQRSIELSRGPYVKFLHADDVLFPECVERMVKVVQRSESIGLVFARRRIEIQDEQNADHRNFRRTYRDAHREFGPLEEVNDGRRMLRRWIAARFDGNWVGEPSNVMMRRTALERLGSFNPRIRMLVDVEMWARAMAYYDIGFIDEELSAYRFHPGSLTIRQGAASRWLDVLWVLEGLADDPDIDARFPELDAALADERRRIARVLARTALRDRHFLPGRLRDIVSYAGFLARHRAGRVEPLHPPLPPAPAHT